MKYTLNTLVDTGYEQVQGEKQGGETKTMYISLVNVHRSGMIHIIVAH